MNAYRLDFSVALRFLAAALIFAVAAPAFAETRLRTSTIAIGPHRLKVEVVRTDPDRARGLMFREKLGRDEGMLFVFDEPAYHSMWMKNTLIPLSVAFVDQSGAIINIADMQPHTRDSHAASKPVKYALEVNQGWFKKRGVKPGAKVEGIERAPPAR